MLKLFKSLNINYIARVAFVFSVIFLTILTIYFTRERYHNYIFGKFDLGNMNQMLYNSARGNFMVLTDYFGDNAVRWSMSHVDPSLLIFIPISLIYSDAQVLLIAQTLSFAISCFLIYLICQKEGLNSVQSSIIGLFIMLFPLSGYILVWTTFHSLVLGMPFMLMALYFIYDYPLVKDKYFTLTKKIRFSLQKFYLLIIYSSVFLVITSKEELGFILFAFSIFLYFKFSYFKKHIYIIALIGLIFSLLSFFVIIPFSAQMRSESVRNFIESIEGTDDADYEHLDNENYFLYRYKELGGSYSEIIVNSITKPNILFSILFSESNLKTLNQVLLPSGYSIFATPLLFLAFVPEVLIHMLSGDEKIFNITNHRLTIVIPILVLSIVFVTKRISKINVKLSYVYLLILLLLNIYTAFDYKNPLLYPFFDKATRLITLNSSIAIATENEKIEFNNIIRKECADYVVNYINKYDKVSVPQPLGAKTSNRYYNALFPAGMDTADVVVADIYDRKLLDFLDLSTNYNKVAVNKFLNTAAVELNLACDRFLVLEKVVGVTGNYYNYNTDSIGKIRELPSYSEASVGNILKESKVYDFSYKTKEDNKIEFKYVYSIGDEDYRDSLFAYTILTNGSKDWTFVHFPSTYLYELNDWPVGTVLEEVVKLKKPGYLPKGKYSVFFGIGNREKNESNIKIGEINL